MVGRAVAFSGEAAKEVEIRALVGLLFKMSRNEFAHLEHADLTFAIEDRLERVIRIDHGSFLFILATVLLDVVPELFGKLRAR